MIGSAGQHEFQKQETWQIGESLGPLARLLYLNGRQSPRGQYRKMEKSMGVPKEKIAPHHGVWVGASQAENQNLHYSKGHLSGKLPTQKHYIKC